METSLKWVDNLLSHHTVEGVSQERQGVARRISFEGAFRLWVIQRLAEGLRMPLDIAVEASRALANGGSWTVGQGIELRMDRIAALADLNSRLDRAVESAPLPRRGRPPIKAKRDA
jgi:hypothetical protein